MIRSEFQGVRIMNEIVRKAEEPWKSILLSWATLFFLFLMIRNASETLLGFGAAALFMLSFALNPDAFRDRRGSYRTVYGLMAFLWVCGAIPILLTRL